MIKVIKGLPKHILGFEVSGVVSAEDYETVIIPAVDAADTGDRKLRMLYHVAPGFKKFDFGAMWDDTKVGLKHLTSWEKVAVVTDEDWIRSAIKVFGFAIPGQFRAFKDNELAVAKKWLTE